MNNDVYITDRVPELKDVVNHPPSNLENMNKSIKGTPEDAFIEEISDFLDMVHRRTRIRMANQLMRLFNNHRFNISLLG